MAELDPTLKYILIIVVIIAIIGIVFVLLRSIIESVQERKVVKHDNQVIIDLKTRIEKIQEYEKIEKESLMMQIDILKKQLGYDTKEIYKCTSCGADNEEMLSSENYWYQDNLCHDCSKFWFVDVEVCIKNSDGSVDVYKEVKRIADGLAQEETCTSFIDGYIAAQKEKFEMKQFEDISLGKKYFSFTCTTYDDDNYLEICYEVQDNV